MVIQSRIPTSAPSASFSWTTPELERVVSQRLELMSDRDKCQLLSGADMWSLRPLAHCGLAATRVADCGHGVTQTAERTESATCYPTGIAMASTWNEALIEELGRALASDCRRAAVDILLGPMINLHRIPLNGRSFETFSEDPVLAGVLGGAEIRGLQAEGIGACLKAVVANNQQRAQHATSVEIDEGPLRELYLRAFEIAVREGEPVSIMTSYNPLWGEQTAESRWLLRHVIKNAWQFPGFTVSDWRAVRSSAVYGAGLDLEMPGPGTLLGPEALAQALDAGDITQEDLDDRARRIVRARVACAQNLPGARRPGGQRETRELDPVDVARRVAEEAIVLLKNDGCLPLDRSRLNRIAVIGPNAGEARLGGGGSASVSPAYAISPLDGIRALAGADCEVVYAEGCGLLGDHEVLREGVTTSDESGFRAVFYGGDEPAGSPVWEGHVPQIDFSWGWSAPVPGVAGGRYAVAFDGELTIPSTGEYSFTLIGQEGPIRMWLDGDLVIDDWFGERERRNFEAEFEIRRREVGRTLEAGSSVSIVVHYAKRSPRAAVRLEWRRPGAGTGLARARQIASDANAVILCLGLSNIFEGGNRDRTTMALPDAQIELLEEVTEANPSTIAVLFNGGPIVVPWVDRVAALVEAWYPGQEGGSALARILFGEVDPSGRLPDTIAESEDDYAALTNYPGNGSVVHYREGRAVGYRHFDIANITPRFSFGFGLSYTTFSVGAPALSADKIAEGGSVIVSVEATNTGTRSGKCVVQLYTERRLSGKSVYRELRNFAKVALAVGGSVSLEFALSWWDLAQWSDERGGWIVPAGGYRLGVGQHSRDLQFAKLTVVG